MPSAAALAQASSQQEFAPLPLLSQTNALPLQSTRVSSAPSTTQMDASLQTPGDGEGLLYFREDHLSSPQPIEEEGEKPMALAKGRSRSPSSSENDDGTDTRSKAGTAPPAQTTGQQQSTAAGAATQHLERVFLQFASPLFKSPQSHQQRRPLELSNSDCSITGEGGGLDHLGLSKDTAHRAMVSLGLQLNLEDMVELLRELDGGL